MNIKTAEQLTADRADVIAKATKEISAVLVGMAVSERILVYKLVGLLYNMGEE